MRDYVQRNFVDKGMCADWAIHDSENDKGQHNLHIHVLLTMRPLTENGEWGTKQKKIYDLDENGEKIPVIDKKTGQQKVDKRNRKQWKCHTADSTDWNSKENAKTYKESQSLKGFAKMRYDKEHKDSLSKYPELKERMQSLLQNGEKITPKQWKVEIQSLQSEYNSIGKEQTKTATELAYAEVISYNKKNLERELQNESRQHNRQQSRTKRREEEI